jgi:TonB family protein
MTRLIFLPALLCCPFLSHAQTNAAKEASISALSTVQPASFTTPPVAISVTKTANTLRPTSRGVVPPTLIHTLAMKDDGNQHVHISGRQRVVTVYLTVNEAGQPTDLNIPEPVDDALDVEVLATVGKFRYKPATLDGKPIAMAVHMHYVVPVGAVY